MKHFQVAMVLVAAVVCFTMPGCGRGDENSVGEAVESVEVSPEVQAMDEAMESER